MPLPKPPGCSDCSLNIAKTCTGFMRPEGSGSRRVMIVGEALGKNEYELGTPFVKTAAAGSVLERAITGIKGLKRDDFVLINMVWGKPRNNELEGESYEQEAIDNCSQYVSEAIAKYRPKAILALGNVPLKHLTGHQGKDHRISDLRGYPLEGIGSAAGIPVIPSYHPAFLARGAERLVTVLRHDIGRALGVANPKIDNPATWWIDNIEEAMRQKILDYTYNPPYEELMDFLAVVTSDPTLLIPYDIETDYTAKGKRKEEETGGKGDNITHIQFSLRPGHGIALSFDLHRDFAQRVLSLPNPKAAHNGWRFDRVRLRKAGIEVKGITHDTMVMWNHIQPDLFADLQSVASMFYFPFPWAFMGVGSPIYMCADVDSVNRIMQRLPQDLKDRGLWNSYMEMVVGLQPVLEGMQDRGIYVDLEERARFRAETAEELKRLDGEIQREVPTKLKGINPPEGYATWPKELREACLARPDISGLKKVDQPKAIKALADTDREFIAAQCVSLGLGFKEFKAGWRPFEQLEFLANSPAQVKGLIKEFGYPIPKNLDGGDTTEKDEVFRLIEKVKKEIEKLEGLKRPTAEHYNQIANKKRFVGLMQDIILYKEYNKVDSTYNWPVDEEALVHTQYTFRSATWQLTSVAPNVQNGIKHGRLAKPWLKTLAARPGHTLINFDYKSCHCLTMAFEARDKDYERITRIDGHSFLAAHMLKMPDRNRLIDMTDDEFKDYVKWFKSDEDRLFTRNKKAKVLLLGWQLGLEAEHAYRDNQEYFKNKAEVKGIQDMLRGLFPKVTKWQHWIREKAHMQGYLISRYDAIRWFPAVMVWNSRVGGYTSGADAEAAQAFFIQNHAFGKIREAMLEIHERELDELYWMNNCIHDSLEFDCPDPLVEACISDVYEIMTKPAKRLVDPELWPDGLHFNVEVTTGKNKAPWHETKNPEGMREVRI